MRILWVQRRHSIQPNVKVTVRQGIGEASGNIPAERTTAPVKIPNSVCNIIAGSGGKIEICVVINTWSKFWPICIDEVEQGPIGQNCLENQEKTSEYPLHTTEFLGDFSRILRIAKMNPSSPITPCSKGTLFTFPSRNNTKGSSGKNALGTPGGSTTGPSTGTLTLGSFIECVRWCVTYYYLGTCKKDAIQYQTNKFCCCSTNWLAGTACKQASRAGLESPELQPRREPKLKAIILGLCIMPSGSSVEPLWAMARWNRPVSLISWMSGSPPSSACVKLEQRLKPSKVTFYLLQLVKL